MLPIETRKQIFIRRFIDGDSLSEIGRLLNLSRTVVTKYVGRYAQLLESKNITAESNLLNYMEEVISQDMDKHKPRNKVDPTTYAQIEKLYKEYLLKRDIDDPENDFPRNLTELFKMFQVQGKMSSDESIHYNTEITYNSFYKVIGEIKEKRLSK